MSASSQAFSADKAVTIVSWTLACNFESSAYALFCARMEARSKHTTSWALQ